MFITLNKPNIFFSNLITASFVILLSISFSIPALSADQTIEMLNKLGKENMVFSKKIVKVDIGDTVFWKSIKPGHNVEFIKGGVPTGVDKFKSKISKVIYSVLDIDKRVKGKTFKILNSKKINVHTGLLKNMINEFYTSYFYNRRKRLPFINGKIAVAKNNLIYSKNKKKITNWRSDKFTHLLRYKNDSILISYKTLNKDNPKLTCRLTNIKKF